MGIRYGVLVSLIVLAALTACAGGGQTALDPAAGTNVPETEITVMDETIMVPAGVDPELVQRLAQQLEDTVASRETSEAYPPSDWFEVEVDTSGTAPVLRWEYILPGGYDLNGAVNAQDIVPIAQGFGLDSADAEYSDYLMLDGDCNGEINVADITPIGRYYGAKFILADFVLYVVTDNGGIDYYTRIDVEIPETPDWSHPWEFIIPAQMEDIGRRFYGYLDDIILGPPEPLFLHASYGAYPDHIELTWRSTPYGGASDYVIYRDDPTEPYAVLDTSDWTYPYEDHDIEYGKEHTYWVQSRSWIFTSKLSEPAVGLALDWQDHEVDGTGQTGRHPTIAVVDGRPAISYTNETDWDIWYAAAATAYPQQNQDWNLHQVTDLYFRAGHFSQMRLLADTPIILHTYNTGNEPFKFLQTTTSNPQNEADWLDSGIVEFYPPPGESDGGNGGLTVIDGKPAACYIQYPDTVDDYQHVVMYARALNSQPSGPDDWLATPIASGTYIGIMTYLTSHDGRPAMLWHNKLAENEYELVYARALTAEPTSEADWQVSTVALTGNTIYASDLEFVEDHPAVLYLDTNRQDDLHSQFRYLRASIPEPTGPADWRATELAYPEHYFEVADLAVVGGRPAAVFTSRSSVILAWASISNPQYTRDWNIIEIADLSLIDNEMLGEHLSITELDGLPIVAFGEDLDDAGSSLRFISPVWP